MTRSEIERAIQEFEDNAYHPSLKPEVSEESKAVALRVLRAELARQDAKPLTCDGCEYVAVEMAVTRCSKCTRFALLRDRYKPKGAY